MNRCYWIKKEKERVLDWYTEWIKVDKTSSLQQRIQPTSGTKERVFEEGKEV